MSEQKHAAMRQLLEGMDVLGDSYEKLQQFFTEVTDRASLNEFITTWVTALSPPDFKDALVNLLLGDSFWTDAIAAQRTLENAGSEEDSVALSVDEMFADVQEAPSDQQLLSGFSFMLESSFVTDYILSDRERTDAVAVYQAKLLERIREVVWSESWDQVILFLKGEVDQSDPSVSAFLQEFDVWLEGHRKTFEERAKDAHVAEYATFVMGLEASDRLTWGFCEHYWHLVFLKLELLNQAQAVLDLTPVQSADMDVTVVMAMRRVRERMDYKIPLKPAEIRAFIEEV